MPHLPSSARLTELLGRAHGRRIAVIGDVMLDVYVSGDVDRISPEAPVPVVRVRSRTYALGGAANVAQNVTAAGAQCTLLGVVGADREGTTIREMLVATDVRANALVEVGRCTTQKTRILARAQQLVRVDEEEDRDLTGDELARVIEAVHAVVSDADALVLEDYNKGVLVSPVIRAALEAARARGIPSVVDPKFRNFFLYRGATIFKPNRRELESAVGASIDIEHPEALPDLLGRLGVEHLLLTLGEQGMVLISEAGELARVPTVARSVYDVVGAGDTVTAYLATMLAAGASPVEAASIANIAAGIEVGKLGAQTVSPAEILEHAEWMALQ
ncbi:MAG: rfaE [Gemmatimonadetes bacterium]|jgi:rfaE bifunctional protein kinase chain/domain|nr:rfaE [Gemmatimonadota bacterium]